MVDHSPPSSPHRTPDGVVIVGTGGHGRELFWALRDSRPADVAAPIIVGFVDDSDANDPLVARLGSTRLGGVSELERGGWATHYVLGIGSGATRARLAARFAPTALRPADVVHRSVQIGPDVDWGPGFVACANVSVTTNVRFGVHVHLNRHVTVGHDCEMGDFVTIHPGAIISGNVRLGARAMVGAGAVLLPGVSVGADARIGAGAVVTSDVPDGVTVVGVPARPVPPQGT